LALLRGPEAYFWRTNQGAELDLLVMHKGKRYGFEMKMGDAPTPTKSMRIALDDLGLARLYIIYPGKLSYVLDHKLEVLSLLDLPAKLAGLG
jgi:hypothetical protein